MENMVKKGEIDCNKQMHFKMSSTICFSLDQSKILSSGNVLNIAKMTISLFDSGKQCGKRRKCWFSHSVFQSLLLKGH